MGQWLQRAAPVHSPSPLALSSSAIVLPKAVLNTRILLLSPPRAQLRPPSRSSSHHALACIPPYHGYGRLGTGGAQVPHTSFYEYIHRQPWRGFEALRISWYISASVFARWRPETQATGESTTETVAFVEIRRFRGSQRCVPSLQSSFLPATFRERTMGSAYSLLDDALRHVSRMNGGMCGEAISGSYFWSEFRCHSRPGP